MASNLIAMSLSKMPSYLCFSPSDGRDEADKANKEEHEAA